MVWNPSGTAFTLSVIEILRSKSLDQPMLKVVKKGRDLLFQEQGAFLFTIFLCFAGCRLEVPCRRYARYTPPWPSVCPRCASHSVVRKGPHLHHSSVLGRPAGRAGHPCVIRRPRVWLRFPQYRSQRS